MESEIANATLRALRRILRATETGSRKLGAATGLTPSQLLVLREVAGAQGATPGQVAQRLQGPQQALVVALVQANGWLVEDVQHADQPRADLRREANALRFASRQSI